MRGSGKTTRMVEEALVRGARGEPVMIFALDARHVHYIRGIISDFLARQYVPNTHNVRVRVYDRNRFHQDTAGFRGEWFIDHAVEESGADVPFRQVWAPPVMAYDFALHGDRTGIAFYRTTASLGRPSRESRFDALRAEGKKLGEINTILEAEGFSEVFGEGVMPCPTKHHAIVRENKGAKRMIAKMGDT